MESLKPENWKEKALEGFGRYLEAVEGEIDKEGGVVEIEAAMLKHYQEMMSETMQALADSQELSPRTSAR